MTFGTTLVLRYPRLHYSVCT
jgi:hypothetical protein